MNNIILFSITGENVSYFYHGALTAIKSVKSTNPHIPIVIFYDFLTKFQKRALSGCRLVKVRPLYNGNHRRDLTNATWFKFYLEILEGVDRVLYLDSDLVVLDSLDEIFKMEGKIVACGIEDRHSREFVDVERVKANENIKEDDLLFNGGVICFDRKYWARNKIKEKVLEVLNMYGEHNFINLDQGVASILAYRHGGFTNISHHYNYLLYSDMVDKKPSVVLENARGFKAPYLDDGFVKILHWNGSNKPWRLKTLIKHSRNKQSHYYSCYKQFVDRESLKWIVMDYVAIIWHKITKGIQHEKRSAVS